MPDHTRSQSTGAKERLCDYCGTAFPPKNHRQRFCHDKCRYAHDREKKTEGLPARAVTGPRRVRDGWSVTIHLPELPAIEPGDEIRIKMPPPEIDLPGGTHE